MGCLRLKLNLCRIFYKAFTCLTSHCVARELNYKSRSKLTNEDSNMYKILFFLMTLNFIMFVTTQSFATEAVDEKIQVEAKTSGRAIKKVAIGFKKLLA